VPLNGLPLNPQKQSTSDKKSKAEKTNGWRARLGQTGEQQSSMRARGGGLIQRFHAARAGFDARARRGPYPAIPRSTR